MRKVAIEEAIGLPLAHDITEILPGKAKGRAFQRGHIVTDEDITRLLRLGKKHIYVWDADGHLVHEDDAAVSLARAASGSGVSISEPSQGRVNLKAAVPGLLKIRVNQLQQLNNCDGIIFATLHNNSVVKENQTVAGTRIIPLAINKELLLEAEQLASQPLPLVEIKPFQSLRVGVITTGSEVSTGLIRDGFGDILRPKIEDFGGRWMGQTIVTDDPELIASEISNFMADGAQLILVTGGMSVDADDATPRGIRISGAQVVFHGAPVLPGAHFMLAYLNQVPICGVPGGALFNKVTTLDLVLPRIFAGERISRADVVALGHGGLCQECRSCHFPNCSFGKSSPF